MTSECSYTNDQKLKLPLINLLLPAWGRETLEKEKIMGKIWEKHLTLISWFKINCNSKRQGLFCFRWALFFCLFGGFFSRIQADHWAIRGAAQELRCSLGYTVLIWWQGGRSAFSSWFLGLINLPVMAVCPWSGGSLLEGEEGRERNVRDCL